jgi:hypothetical protein
MDLTINLKTEEEKDRYNYIKDLVQRLYPHVASDTTLGNMSEYLYIYYAIHEKFPDPPAGFEKESAGIQNIQLMEEYHTPADIADTLKPPEEHSILPTVIDYSETTSSDDEHEE